MASELENYRRLFNDLYGQLDEILDGLTTEALLWKPFERSPWKGESGQLGWVIAHAVSSTVYLLRRAEWAMGKREWTLVDGDEGSAEFGPANHDPVYLRERAKRTHALADAFLVGLSQTDLNAERPHPKRADRTFSARHDIVHAIDHLSQHIGHAQLTRQLWALQG